MSFKAKSIKVGQHDVEVSCVKVGKHPNPVYCFTARIGDVAYDHPLTMTVGPLDGEVPDYPLEQFQKDVDGAREHAAKHAAFRHGIEELEQHVK
jgi:hypothetical protein